MVTITAEQATGSAGPSAGVTLTGLGAGASVLTLWRNDAHGREPVAGQRRITMTDAGYIIDYHVPLGRPVTYEVEVLSGPTGSQRASAAPVTITSASSWIMDPLIPQSAIPVTDNERDGVPWLRAKALAALEFAADVSLIKIMGQDNPMGLFGQRMRERGVDISMATDSAEQNKRLKELLLSSANLLYRPLPSLTQVDLPGSMFVSLDVVRELPVNMGMDGFLTNWDLVADSVKAPVIKVLTATFTYGDVKAMYATYGDKQAVMAGKSYLDDLKNPTG